MTGVLLFNPYIGDSFLSSAMARAIWRETGERVSVATMNTEMNKIAREFGANTFMGNWQDILMERGKDVADYPIQKVYREGSFRYSFRERDIRHWQESKGKQRLIEETFDELASEFDTFYIGHWSLPYALFGAYAMKRGKTVRGYFIDETSDRLMMNTPEGVKPAKIWSDDFIGNRVLTMLAGFNLGKDDFEFIPWDVLQPSRDIIRGRVLIIPGTRGEGLPTAGNWEMDFHYLEDMGFKPEFVEFHKENKYPHYHPTRYKTLLELTELMSTAEFVICNDSAPFHMAWYTGTPAIVKLKGGFNKEWIPDWVIGDYRYAFIRPEKVYEEEYVGKLEQAIRALTV